MTTLHSPLLNGFHPDPSVVAADGAYYLATSTFEYLPGIPIHRSIDFETWELIGHVATRPGQLGVEHVPTGGGAWAPTIRHHDGVFHLVITDAMGRGMLHFTATDAAGPWSDGELLRTRDGNGTIEGIDPDIAWDAAGTAYVTFSGLQLTGALDPNAPTHLGIQQVRVDLGTHLALEEPRSLWSGTGLMFPEAPHLYEIDGRWYLMIAEGGTERGHGISIARGDSPEGPFEPAPANPLVSARSTPRPIQNTGHGDLVVGPGGQWLCVLLGVRPRSGTRAFSALGRETFVTPVTWSDGWPAIAPVERHPRPGTRTEPDLGSLDGEWIAVRRLPSELADLETRPGAVVLHADGSTLADPQPVFLGRRQEHLNNATTVRLDVSGGTGGIAVRYDEHFHVEVEAGDGRVTARATLSGIVQEWTGDLATPVVDLHLDSVPPAGGGLVMTSDVFRLGFTPDGGERVHLADVDGRFLSSEVTESFTGRVIGVYATAGDVVLQRWVSDGDDA